MFRTVYALILLISSGCALIGQATAAALPEWLDPGAEVSARATAVTPTTVELSYRTNVPPSAVVARYQQAFRNQNVFFLAGFDGLGTTIRAATDRFRCVVRVRPEDEATQVSLNYLALPEPPAPAPPPAVAPTAPAPTAPVIKVPDLAWPEWLEGPPGSQTGGEPQAATGKECPYWSAKSPDRPCLFQRFQSYASVKDLFDYYGPYLERNGYSVREGGVTPSVRVENGKQSRSYSGHLAAYRTTPDSERTVYIGIAEDKGRRLISITVTGTSEK